MSFWKVLIPGTNNISPVNYCSNPSVERFIDDGNPYGTYTPVGGATISRQESTGAVQPYSGGWMVKVVSAASTDGVWCPTFWPTVSGLNAFFAFSIWAASTDTITASMYTTGGGAPVATVATVTGNNKWQRISGGANVVPSSSSGLMFNGSGTFYIDALDYSVVVDSSEYIEREYIDGDQPGCFWEEKPHGSPSVRDSQSRDGGTWFDLADYGLAVIQPGGIGMPPVFLNSQQTPNGNGAVYLGQVKNPRVISLATTAIGSSRSDLHAKRSWLIDAIQNNSFRGNQPIWFEYSGGVTPVRIRAVYNDGLQVAQFNGFTEDVILSLVAFDPDFISPNDGSALFTGVGTTDAGTNITRINSVNRINGSETVQEYVNFPYFNGDIFALAFSKNGELYAGGSFTDTVPASSTDFSRIAKYNKSTGAWTSLLTGVNGTVYSIAPLPNGNVALGGAFTADGSANPLGYFSIYSSTGYGSFSTTDFNGDVYAMTINPRTGQLVVGGNFTTGGGTALGYIAQSSTSGWIAVGSSTDFDASVNSLVYDKFGNLYAGGTFASAGALAGAVQKIARLSSTGGDWQLVGGVSTSDVAGGIYAMAIDGNNILYAGGNFVQIGSVLAGKIAAFDGQRWLPLGDGLDGIVTGMVFDDYGLLHVAGEFSNVGVNTFASPYYAVWNGSTFIRTGMLPSSHSNAIAIDPSRRDIYLGFDASSFGIEYSLVTAITNNASEKVSPVFVIGRSGGTTARIEKIRNITIGDQINLNLYILDGGYITIDTGAATVVSAQLGDVTSNDGTILAGSDFSGFSLLPGINKIAVFVRTVDAPTVEAYTYWKNRYKSSDGTSST